MPGAEVVAVSAKTGAGLDELRAALARPQRSRRARASGPRACTSTASSPCAGSARSRPERCGRARSAEGDELRAEPAGLDVRVRSVAGARRAGRAAEAGQRVAVAVPGIERRELRRGDALVAPGAFPRQLRLDVALDELEPIATARGSTSTTGRRTRVARVVRAGERYAQLRLAAPLVAARGDRVVLRTRTTVGGGVVLDPAPPRTPTPSASSSSSAATRRSSATIVHAPVTGPELQARGLLAPGELARGLAACCAGDWYFSEAWLEELRRACASACGRDAARSARSRHCRSANCCSTGRGRTRSRRCSSSSAAAASSTCPAARRRSTAARRRRAALEAERRVEHGFGKRRRRASSARSSSTRAGSTASATASPSRASCTSAGSTAIRELDPITLAGFRDRARRLAPRSRSSCSSATTRTASRAASATSVC